MPAHLPLSWHQPPPRLSPRGVEEPESCCHKRLHAACPTGFYREALRTYAGMLSLLAWQELPVVSDDNLVEESRAKQVDRS
jgi:hypothetical protein